MMNRNMKLLRNALILLVILILLIVIILLLIKDRSNKGTSEIEKPTEFEQQELYEPEEMIEKVKNANKYYTVELLIERYMTYRNDLQDETLDNNTKRLTQKALVSILDESYKKENHINESNVERLGIEIQPDEGIEIEEMYLVEKDAASNIFLVYGKKVVEQEDFQLMVRTDSSQMIFSIFPEEYMEKSDYSPESKKEDFEELFSDELEKNDYNKFQYSNISNERMAVEYFNDMKKKILLNTKIAYNLLDPEYKEKRFGSYETFDQYVQLARKDLAKIEINGYQVKQQNGNKVYICKDQYNNIYSIEEIAIKEYTVKLDRYTIKDDEFLKIYHKSSDKEKVATNMDIWLQMINNRDYQSAYNVLDENFRNNYFKSVGEFTTYMQEQFPDHYKIEFGENKNEANIYTQQVTFISMEKEEKKVEKTFVMQLKENDEFVISANFITD